MLHNLPSRKPYKEFFGRKESIELIKSKLLNRIGHIASIDGVGGIGKTALTYYFCESILIPQNQFDFLVWVSAKDTYFDPFDKENQIKKVENRFKVNPVEVLIEETIKVTGFEDSFLGKSLEEKKDFFENEILKNEKIFFVIDNLENIQGDDFFLYLDSFANYNNTKLKILTTSRKREKVLTDNAIRIDEILEDDAIDMLRFLAKSINPDKPVKLILNEGRSQNAVLANKANRIPIVLEFIVGQLSFGKSVGQIMQVLEGFPDVKSVSLTERDKVISNIISFMFQYMYEDLSREHQLIFKLICAYQRNKKIRKKMSH